MRRQAHDTHPCWRATRVLAWSACVGACMLLVSNATAAGSGARAVHAAAKSVPAPPQPAAPIASPEARLIQIYRQIGGGRSREALVMAAALVHDEPNFRLAHLVYADLLTARRTGLSSFGGGAATALPGVSTGRLEELRAEAALRLQALRDTPPPGAVPRQFLTLPETTRHAIAVDASRSRLYLLEHDRQGMKLVASYYVSLGRLGLDKRTEGDQRTPLGVYFVSDRMGGGSLEQRFGAGAMQINYPNAFDKLRGRTGSGIYLHGVPFDTYSRPPKDSDGCVALANDELLMLMNTVPLHDTPVIITRQIHWVRDDVAQQHRAEILDAVNHWQSVRASEDHAALDAFYQPGVAPETPAAPPAPPPQPTVVMVHGKRRVIPAPAVAPRDPIAFDNLSVLTWSDEKDTMVVTFNERGTRTHRETVLRQYWERDAAKWKIVAEGTVR